MMKYIELFSVFFMFLLAYVFYCQSNATLQDQQILTTYKDYSPFFIGIILSCFNLVQIPFWCGWNLYLVNGNFIYSKSNLKFLYVFGTMLGTFSGMLSFILSLDLVATSYSGLSPYLMSHIIPLFFIGMGFFQAYKFYRKHF